MKRCESPQEHRRRGVLCSSYHCRRCQHCDPHDHPALEEDAFREFMDIAMHYCRTHPKTVLIHRPFEYMGMKFEPGLLRLPADPNEECEYCAPEKHALARELADTEAFVVRKEGEQPKQHEEEQ